jgi:hypothetical protein
MPQVKYSYVGAANWGDPQSASFFTPLFQNGNKTYVQVISIDYTVKKFREVYIPESQEIVPKKKDYALSKNDLALFYFNVGDGDPIVGTKPDIEAQLLALLEESQLSEYPKFLIADFLNLYGKQFFFLDKINTELTELGVEKVDPTSILDKAKSPLEFSIDLLKSRLARLSTLFQRIQENDIIFIGPQWAYFDNRRFSLASVFNKAVNENAELDLILSNSLKQSLDSLDVALRKRVESNLNVVEYMASSPNYFKNEKFIGEELIGINQNLSSAEFIMRGAQIEHEYASVVELKTSSKITDNQIASVLSQCSEIISSFKIG